MATKRPTKITGLNLQAARRTLHSTVCLTHPQENPGNPPFYDQHHSPRWPEGRPWWCYTEIMADGVTPPMPCTPLAPDGWSAPWYPDEGYADFSRKSYGRFEWRWDRMLADDTEQYQAYYLAAAEIADRRNMPALEVGDPLPFAIRAVLRTPPRNPKIAEALLAGDPWMLGLRSEVNPALAKVLGMAAVASTPLPGTEDVVQPMGRVLTMTVEELDAHIAQAVAAAIATQAKPVQRARAAPGKRAEISRAAAPPLSPWQLFMQEQRKAGYSMAEISEMWKLEKKQIAVGA